MIRGYQDEGRVTVGAFVAPSLKRDLVELAYLERKTVSAVIRDALSEKVARGLPAKAETGVAA